jgi:hypothetical protein
MDSRVAVDALHAVFQVHRIWSRLQDGLDKVWLIGLSLVLGFLNHGQHVRRAGKCFGGWLLSPHYRRYTKKHNPELHRFS